MLGGAPSEVEAAATRGGLLILAGGFAASVIGLAYWLLMPRLAGLSAVDEASAAVGAAGVAAALTSAGLPVAVLREAAEDPEGASAGLAAGVLLGLAAGLLGLALVYTLSLKGVVAALTAATAGLTVYSAAALQALVGLEGFGEYSRVIAAASLAKLAAGTAMAVAGLGALAVLGGYMAHPLAAAAAATAAVASASGLRRPGLGRLRRLLLLAASNYPQGLSQQLPVMLNVYLYALLGGTVEGTGGLYLSLMIALALTMLPGSLSAAALPVGERRGRVGGLIAQQLRLGLAAMAPLAAAVAAAPYTVLYVVKPELARQAWRALAVLAASTPAVAAVNAAVLELNRRRSIGMVALLGGVRLAALLVLLPPLTKAYGAAGAAAAYAAASLAALPLALRALPGAARPVLASLAATMAAGGYSLAASPHTVYAGLASGAAWLAATAAVVIAARVAEQGQLRMLARLLLRRLGGGH